MHKNDCSDMIEGDSLRSSTLLAEICQTYSMNKSHSSIQVFVGKKQDWSRPVSWTDKRLFGFCQN